MNQFIYLFYSIYSTLPESMKGTKCQLNLQLKTNLWGNTAMIKSDIS